MRSEVHSLADVPLPLVHTALGMAVCAVVAALRPQVLGLRASVTACGALAVGTALTLALYDRFVYGRDLRHAVAATALPVAAIGAFTAVIASTGDLALRVPAGVVAALVIGGIPHLGGLRAAGREGTAARLLRDGAGIVVLAPLLLAASSATLTTSASAALAAGSVLLVTVDALLTETIAGRVAVAAAFVVGALLGGVVVALPRTGHGALRASLLLLLWYGVRGSTGAVLGRSRRPAAIAEYALFVVAAAVGLGLGAVRG